MLVKQLSVFMEKPPRQVVQTYARLGEGGDRFRHPFHCGHEGFGSCGFIARDNEKAYEILKREGFTVGITELIGVEVDDKPNALAEVIA